MNSASLAGRYDNPIPPRFLAPIVFLKIPAQYDNPMPTCFLAPIAGQKLPTWDLSFRLGKPKTMELNKRSNKYVLTTNKKTPSP